MKKIYLLALVFLSGCYPSNVLDKITDPEFQKYVMKFDNNGDHKISREEALMVTVLDYTSKAQNFEGIEYFENLEEFDVDHDDDFPLYSLDLSQNKKLKRVSLRWCEDLKTLKLPENLEGLHITRMGLDKLELGSMPWLTNISIECYSNTNHRRRLTFKELTIKDAPNLKSIGIEGTDVSNIDLSKFKLLEYFSSKDNNIKSLDISKNPNLKGLNCKGIKELIMKRGATIDGVNSNPDYEHDIDDDLTIKYVD